MSWLPIARRLVAVVVVVAAIAVGIWTGDWRWGAAVLGLGLIVAAFGLGRTIGF